MTKTRELFVGRIPFLVCCPYLHYSLNAPPSSVKFTDGVPYELNQLLAHQKIDCAPTSSIEYAQNFEKYILFPHLCIGSHQEHKKVASVLFFSNIPLEKLSNQPILLSKSSMTSNVLFQILCLEKYHQQPNLINPHFLNPKDLHIEGKICIGDAALEEDLKKWTYSYDLAQIWYQWLNLPFVFGLWIINQQAYDEKYFLLLDFYQQLQESLKQFKEDPQTAFQQWQKFYPSSFSPAKKEDFIHSLEYNLNTKHIESLNIFYKKAYLHGFIPKKPSLKFISELLN